MHLMNPLLFNCPHCRKKIMVMPDELFCKIFRHGVYKSNYQQIHPHLNKDECDKLKKQKLIYGCGKPTKIIIEKDEKSQNIKYKMIKCDYI